MENSIEKVYVIQPILDDNYKVLHSEIIDLIESADAVYIGTTYQKIKEINPATFLGSGKLVEIASILKDIVDVTVLFNGELSPSQTLNISSALNDIKVIDRTTLILDIFAKNATTSEGKYQVELAQLNYIYPRLKGKGEALSRLGGGIGTRGPGESQLETDRRYIRLRINYLKQKLSELKTRRELIDSRRKKNLSKTIALVGYTNTGKSTLLNRLTGSDALVKNQLFATLDPTSRNLFIDGHNFIMIDTVGFLQALPHHLIDAFKSTLESVLNCDLALIVCDATGEYDMQLSTTLSTLKELNFDKDYIIVMNKCESIDNFDPYPSDCVFISAKENIGIENLKDKILQKFQDKYCDCKLYVSYNEIGNYNKIKGFILEKDVSNDNDGIIVDATIPKIYSSKFSKYIKQ